MLVSGDLTSSPAVADTIVVGAGVAGLGVARQLVAAGRSVVVLEGRDRVGGRLRSAQLAGGGRIDLGATWFWPGERRVTALAADLGVRIHDQFVAGDAVYDAPDGPTRIDGNPIDVPAFRFVDGADALTDAIAEHLPPGTIRRSRPVRRIEVSDADVAVDAGDTRFHGRVVVVAVPPAAGLARIEFEPPIPSQLANLARATPVWMGSMTKVVAVYREAFWRSEGLSGAAVSHLGPLREVHDMSGPDGAPAALFGFVPGGGDVDRAAVVEQLTRLFGAGAAHPIELHLADWSADEFTAPDGAGSSSAYRLFGHPALREPFLDGRVVWASTETGTTSPGHIEGALEAAEHAVRTVLATLACTPTPGGST